MFDEQAAQTWGTEQHYGSPFMRLFEAASDRVRCFAALQGVNMHHQAVWPGSLRLAQETREIPS
jgi:hypothetical protein